MWQLYALLSLFASSAESVVDKTALVADRQIDYAIATFSRLAVFFLATLALGASGILGEMRFAFAPLLALVALLSAFNSLAYTYLMRRVEVTQIGAMYYLAPFLFLAIDTTVLRTHLSAAEIAGIVLLVLGGVGFAVDGRTHHLKRELSPAVWALFAFNVLYMGIEAYIFKYMNATSGVSPVSFVASYSLYSAALLFLLIWYQGKVRLLRRRETMSYIPAIAISKSLGSFGSIMWTQALVFAAVSQVSAMEALEPLTLFLMTVLAQEALRLRVGEHLEKRRFRWKAVSVSLLVLGGLLVT